MAHYALLDDNNIVTWVITGNDENFVHEGVDSWEQYYGDFHNQKCLRTSYNTHANQHSHGGAPFRGNFAGIGFEYREDLDAFIPPKPESSDEIADWVLNEETFQWEPVNA